MLLSLFFIRFAPCWWIAFPLCQSVPFALITFPRTQSTYWIGWTHSSTSDGSTRGEGLGSLTRCLTYPAVPRLPFRLCVLNLSLCLTAPGQLSSAGCSVEHFCRGHGPPGASVTSPKARLPLLCQVWELKLFLWKGNKLL